MNKARVVCVVVNYRTPDLTVRAVASLAGDLERLPLGRVVVVDNDSRDGSYERLVAGIAEHGLCGRVQVVASDSNGGYGYGINLVVRAALVAPDPPDLFFILNPDTTIDTGALCTLVAFMLEHPDAGIAGSGLRDPDGTPEAFAFRFPSAAGEFENTAHFGPISKLLGRFRIARDDVFVPTVVDWVSGASMMVRREVFTTAGLFDEGYFLYFEETDLCFRAREHGFRTYAVPTASVAHVGGAATGTQHDRRCPSSWFESRVRYYMKHHGAAYLMTCNAMWTAGHCLWQARRILQRKADTDPPHLLTDFLRRSGPGLMAARPASQS